MKKINIFLLSVIFYFVWLTNYIYAANVPWILWGWLPGWENEWEKIVLKSSFQDTPLWKASVDFVITFIKYIAIIAVISLMFWWIMYILSWWEEEKVKKAKSWIIWSIVWVFMSVSAWWIIKFITQLSI